MDYIFSFLLPYLIGSIPFSYILIRVITKKDLRFEGSGNLGARNSMEIGGTKVGILVLMLDILKGYLSLALIDSIYGMSTLLYVAAFSLVLGHNFPIYLKFHGGKGLAASLGIFAYINPYILLILLAIAGISLLLTRKPNPSAMIAVIFLPFILFIFERSFYSFTAGILISIVILIKHKKDYSDFISIFKR